MAATAEEREIVMNAVKQGKALSLCATQSIFSEGVSLNELSALVAGSLISSEELLEQLIGRVQRPANNKLPPIVVDIRLEGETARRQFYNRKALYTREGWEVKEISRAAMLDLVKQHEQTIS